MLDKIYHTLFLSTPSARRATLFRVLGGKPYQNFYPRPPRGGRPRRICNTAGARSFLSTPSARRATATPPIPENSFEFLSTPSARRATSNGLHSKIHHKISIHALREEGDHRHKQAAEDLHHFYPRPPRGGRLHAVFCPRLLVAISIHALREEGDAAIPEYYWRKLISIHALREEGDGLHHHLHGARRHFYPRPPRGGRLEAYIKPLGLRLFLSTPSARRATRSSRCCASTQQFLSTPSARRATVEVAAQSRLQFISIHALREEGDASVLGTIVGWVSFLSTPSARRATRARGQVRRPVPISIHALREEGDLPSRQPQTLAPHFYPRPPRGGRPRTAMIRAAADKFLSTPSARRATRSRRARSADRRHFYPRPPRGGRPNVIVSSPVSVDFYPRPPRGGRPFRH